MWRSTRYQARWILHAAAAAGLGLGLPGLAWCQSGEDKAWDLLDQMRRTEKVSAQKLDLEVRSAIAEADKLATTDSDKAVARLRAAIAPVRANHAGVSAAQSRPTLRQAVAPV